MKSRTKAAAVMLAVLALLIATTVPVADGLLVTNTQIEGSPVSVYHGKSASLAAGGSVETPLILRNNDNKSQIVTITAFCNGDITSTVSKNVLIFNDDSLKEVSITLKADEYCPRNTYYLTITVTVPTCENAEASVKIPVVVSSTLSSDQYNKFFGFFNNNFDDILGNIWFTLAVSVIGFVAFGYAVMFVGIYIVTRLLMRKRDPDTKRVKKLLYRLSQFVIWIWVAGRSFRILGADEAVIGTMSKLLLVTYVVTFTVAGWQIYKVAINTLIRKTVAKAEDYDVDTVRTDFESFRPLLLYIGEIVIAITSVVVVMNLFGVDVTAIITSAGLVSLGISMGAQDVLKQFFSGLEILATRPFKAGDLIQVGSDDTIYRVRKVNVMNTILGNWDNTDVNILPNSTITTSTIKNITKETMVYKVYLTADIAYGTDVNLARNLMQEAANENEHVVSDGSVDRPYTRLNEFRNSNLVIKMGFYVDDFNYQYSVSGQIRQSIINKFGDHGININYDQIVVHKAEPEIRSNTTARKMSNTTASDKS